MHSFVKNNKGQSLIEGLIISLILIFFMFAALQVCIIVVDDMYFNFVSFLSTRKAIVSENKDILDNAKNVVNKMVLPYQIETTSIISYKVTHWHEQILGKTNKDHSNSTMDKHNIKVGYTSKIMFYKLFNLFTPFRTQSARARMVKSPDENFYNKAYPDAKEFPSVQISL